MNRMIPHAEIPQIVEDIRDMLKACEVCGALIHIRNLDQHDGWHERLRRAVDETGTLG